MKDMFVKIVLKSDFQLKINHKDAPEKGWLVSLNEKTRRIQFALS